MVVMPLVYDVTVGVLDVGIRCELVFGGFPMVGEGDLLTLRTRSLCVIDSIYTVDKHE